MRGLAQRPCEPRVARASWISRLFFHGFGMFLRCSRVFMDFSKGFSKVFEVRMAVRRGHCMPAACGLDGGVELEETQV